MTILNFTLTTEAIGKLHDALACLGKFGEAVSIEASHDKVCDIKYVATFSNFLQLVLTALNSSKSAYCSFTLVGNKFFSKYIYSPVRPRSQVKEKFNCKIYNKVCQARSICHRLFSNKFNIGTPLCFQRTGGRPNEGERHRSREM